MNNLQKVTAAATLTVLGSLSLATKAQAQETYEQPFSGTVPSICVFNDVSNGNPVPLVYDEFSYMFFDDPTSSASEFSVSCPTNSIISVEAPQQTNGPTITANVQSSFGTVSDNSGLGIFADSDGNDGILPGSTLTEFDVGMFIEYSAALAPGNYEFIVPVTFTPD